MDSLSAPLLEKYALALDRNEVVKNLAPGSVESKFCKALGYQLALQEGDKKLDVKEMDTFFAGVEGTNAAYVDYRLQPLLTRQSLLKYSSSSDADKKKILDKLSQRIGVSFNHYKRVDASTTEAKSWNQPTALPSKEYETDTLLQRYFNPDYSTLSSYTPLAYDWLAKQKINKWRRNFLQAVRDPSYPNMVELVLADMEETKATFGQQSFHHLLTLAQLEDLAKRRPALLSETEFVTKLLERKIPKNLTELDVKSRRAYYEATWEFVTKLPVVQNSLKARYYYDALKFEADQGNYDYKKLQQYLELPWNDWPFIRRPVNEGLSTISRYGSSTQYTTLVEDYLKHWYEDKKNVTIDAWKDYLAPTYLKEFMALTKIALPGDLEEKKKWFDLLDPSTLRSYKERVLIKFDPSNPKTFKSTDEVKLNVTLKNVPKLVVKVFKINSAALYRTENREVNAALDIDGLTPHEEKVEEFENVGPYVQMHKTLNFPSLAGQKGDFIIEIVGSGQRARAAFKKGYLTHLEVPSAAGHRFKLFDENGAQTEGSIWIQGHTYYTDKKTGIATAPYSQYSSYPNIILSDAKGELFSLTSFHQLSEEYTFDLGLYVDRESLLQKSEAEVVLRPAISLNGFPVSLNLIQRASLKIDSVNLMGTSSSQTVPELKFTDDGETTHAFNVPDDLRTITFTVSVEVKTKSTGEIRKMSQSKSFEINGIDLTNHIEDLHLRYDEKGYSVYVLGKAGEPRAFRGLSFHLKHSHIRNEIQTTLMQTDEHGKFFLGHLPNITKLTATVEGNMLRRTWTIGPLHSIAIPPLTHGVEGKDVIIPYPHTPSKPLSDDFALFEMRNDAYQTCFLKHLSWDDKKHVLVLSLPQGSYKLIMKQLQTEVRIVIGKGVVVWDHFLMEKSQILELPAQSVGLQVTGLNVKGTDAKACVEITVLGSTPSTRVHVFATHFVPTFDPKENLHRLSPPSLKNIYLSTSQAEYTEQRALSDAQQYVLNRKHAKKYIGNMLPKPSLLLNQKFKQNTNFDSDPVDRAGEAFKESKERLYSNSRRDLAYDLAASSSLSYGGLTYESFTSNLEFLRNPSTRLFNLRVNDAGVVSFPLNSLASGQTSVYVVAIDGPTTLATGFFGLPAKDAVTEEGGLVLNTAYRDTRLLPGLDVKKHFTEQHLISVLPKGSTKSIADIKSALVETYETLNDVYALFRTFMGSSESLQQFEFVLKWPELEEDEKLKQYSEYSCHELNFFIYHKDRKFFDAVIQPFLKDKLQKTFLDLWLLNEDLSEYARPLEYSQLNFVERILLGIRLGGEAAEAIAKSMNDQFDCVRPDPQLFVQLFNTALQTRALSTQAASIPKQKRAEMVKEREDIAMEVMAEADKCKEDQYFDEDGDEACAEREEEEEEEEEQRSPPARARACEEEREIAPRRLYSSPPTTKEYAERNYYETLSTSENKNLINQINGFWRDYANHILRGDAKTDKPGFLSEHFLMVAHNRCFAEMMLALAVLELPFKARKHKIETDRATKFSFTATSNVIMFHKEVKESEQIPSSVSVSQSYFDPLEPTELVDNERVDKCITGDFLVNKIYATRVVITNVSSTQQNLEVLQQIPQGAIPVGQNSVRGFATETTFKTVAPYSTQLLVYYFYFPSPGKYNHYPVHVSKTQLVVGCGAATVLNVVRKQTIVPQRTWKYISQEGKDDDVIKYLQTENLHKPEVTLSDIAFRCKQSKDFFLKTIKILSSRFIFVPTLWSYSLYHGVDEIIREYLPTTRIASDVGDYLVCSLLTKDAFKYQYDTLQHLEYSPLMNSRAHQFDNETQNGTLPIQNLQFRSHYTRFLNYLAYRASTLQALPIPLLLTTTYYLMLQERIDEGMNIFKLTDKNEAITKSILAGGVDVTRETEFQYDYMAAYLDFYRESEPTIALRLAKKYKNFPVVKKRKLFEEIERQLIEASPDSTPEYKTGLDASQRDREMNNLASTHPTLTFAIESNKLNISYANLKSPITINLYEIDAEVMFSTKPFVQNDSKSLFVAPNHSFSVPIAKDQKKVTVDFPEKYRNANVYVEATSDGVNQVLPYYSNSMHAHVIENYGQVKVTHKTTNRPIPRTYVKVYCKTNSGSEEFYKDGYTDIRGTFDYASLSTDKLKSVTKFSLFILTETAGTLVTEAKPPAQ